MAQLSAGLSDVRFFHSTYYSLEEAKRGYETEEKGRFEGWLLFVTRSGSEIAQFYAENVQPLAIHTA